MTTTILSLPSSGTLTGGEFVPADCPNGDGTYTTKKVSAAQIVGSLGGSAALKNTGVSVVDPGTGALEMVLPVQTASGSAKTYTSLDLFKKTRRSNGGVAMTDTLPAIGASGMTNGTRIIIANVDATATLTLTAGSGTTMPGGATDVIGPGRDVCYELDTATNTWRGAYNTRGALLANNNLSDVSNVAQARANLGLSALSVQFQPLTANTQLVSGTQYRILTPGIQLTMPATPSSGDTMRFADGGGMSLVNPPALVYNGGTMMGLTSNMSLNVRGLDFMIWWTGLDWRLN